MTESQASSPDEDDKSDTSTLEWEHEPFETFQSRVQDLVLMQWPSLPEGSIAVERLKGGGYNRIIGFSTQDSDGAGQTEYILRIPRMDNAQLIHDLTPLQFLRAYSDIPIPEVVAFDCTEKNVLGSHYMIQRRLRGGPLLSLYPEMEHEIRCKVAQRLGEVFESLTRLGSQHIGRLTSPNHGVDKPLKFVVEPLEDAAPMASWPWINVQAEEGTSEALIEIFKYRESLAVAHGTDYNFRADYMRRFAAMTSDLNTMGYLEDVSITLCHLDFEPRNILVDVQGQDKPVSGILDWDSAVFAPSFMSCAPPMWIWGWKEDEDEDERTANDIPDTAENRKLKDIFETAAGPVYARFAYEPAYRLARRLVKFAFFGIKYAEDMKDADAMFAEWSDMRSGSDRAVKDDEQEEEGDEGDDAESVEGETD